MKFTLKMSKSLHGNINLKPNFHWKKGIPWFIKFHFLKQIAVLIRLDKYQEKSMWFELTYNLETLSLTSLRILNDLYNFGITFKNAWWSNGWLTTAFKTDICANFALCRLHFLPDHVKRTQKIVMKRPRQIQNVGLKTCKIALHGRYSCEFLL